MSLSSQKKLLEARGGSIKGSFERNARLSSQQDFRNAINYTVGYYNGTQIEMRVVHEKNPNPYTQSRSEQRTFLFLPDQKVDIGGVIDLVDEKFIIHDNTEMDIFPTFYGIKANNTFKIKIGEDKVISGYSSVGQPQYSSVTPIYFERPCYATTNARFNVYTEFKGSVNLPEGRLYIFLPYSPDVKLTDGMEFTMFDDRYRIINVDVSSVYNEKGITELFVEKIQDEN